MATILNRLPQLSGFVGGVRQGGLEGLNTLVDLINGLQGQQVVAGARHTIGSASGTPSDPYYTGPDGLFALGSGVDPQLISTIVQGPSLLAQLPAVPTRIMTPYFGYITGALEGDGDDADWDSSCDDPPTAGALKNCFTTAPFGQYARQTREVDIARVGEMSDRGEFNDFVIVGNNPLLDMGSNMNPSVPGGFNLEREVSMRMMELGIAFQRLLGPQVYIGDPSNNQGTGYQEFAGLDLQIRTDHVDAFTNTSCPSLASVVRNLAYADTGDAADGLTIINELTYLFYYLERLARTTGLDPVTFGIVMRPELFYEITRLWPCNYLTYNCIFGEDADQASLNIDAGDIISMRDAMRNGEYLVIGSKKVPVILDMYMPEQGSAAITEGGGTPANADSFASDMYIIPLVFAGNILGTYLQYRDWGPSIQGASDLHMGPPSGPFWTSDGNKWLWNWKTHVNTCIQAIARTRLRLIVRVPQLTARVRNVQYRMLINTRDVLPGDSYYVNGGVTGRTTFDPYTPW